MGLDMYLVGKRYLMDSERSDTLNKAAGTTSKFPVEKVVVEVGTWRKANAIHRWFVNTVQEGIDNCKEHSVSRSQLQELLALCKRVHEFKHLADAQLPTTSGFFFGSTDVDDWYYSYVQQTIDIIEAALNAPELEKFDFYYQSSW
jgi:hypothetical protein